MKALSLFYIYILLLLLLSFKNSSKELLFVNCLSLNYYYHSSIPSRRSLSNKELLLSLLLSPSYHKKKRNRRRIMTTNMNNVEEDSIVVGVVRNNDDADTNHKNNVMNIKTIHDWSLLNPETLSPTKCLIEQTLCIPPDNVDTIQQQPQLAKDYNYANAILETWKEQEESNNDDDDDDNESNNNNSLFWDSEWKSIQYNSIEPSPSPPILLIDNDTTSISTDTSSSSLLKSRVQVPLYGHLIRRRRTTTPSSSSGKNEQQEQELESDNSSTNPMIGILLFHTGAGPHDIFLLWKACALVNMLFPYNNNVNMIVMITDMLSDSYGWGWNSNRDQYQQTIQRVMMVDDKSPSVTTTPGTSSSSILQQRPILQCRIQAAIRTLQQELIIMSSSNYNDDPNNTSSVINNNNNHNNIQLAALGWCLGGQSILELSKMNILNMKAMVSYHGVFMDDDHQWNHNNDNDDDVAPPTQQKTEILICHGDEDPFVTNESLQTTLYVKNIYDIIIFTINDNFMVSFLNFCFVLHSILVLFLLHLSIFLLVDRVSNSFCCCCFNDY